MVFKVPQFIEVEDKIFGPLTFKQFIYLAGGAGACFIAWSLLPGFLAIFIILPIAGLALALSFYRVNNRPFVILLEAFIQYHLGGRLYLWKKREVKTQKAPSLHDIASHSTNSTIPRLSESKLKDLSWSLDVKDNSNN